MKLKRYVAIARVQTAECFQVSEQKLRILKQQLHTAQSALAAAQSEVDGLKRDVDRQVMNNYSYYSNYSSETTCIHNQCSYAYG